MPLAVNRNSDQYMWASEVGGDDIGRVKQSALEEVAYLVDYSRWLAVDETISSAVVTHSDATTPDLVISADELLDDNKVLFKVSEGREGSRYEIRIEITTSNGQVKIDTLRLSVGSASPSAAFESIWNELSIGTVETGAPGSLAEAEITGDAPNQVLNLVLPSGPTGLQGDQGYQGDQGDPGPEGDVGPAAWGPVAAWAPATDYTNVAPADVVTNNGETFVCHTPHTSGGAFDASKFTKIAQKGADGLGAGDMVGANNLSEITSATTARSNLGLVAVASTGAA
ncbi:MAG: collagen-like protein, partial [Methylomonas sp.]|nr:collagen-like protein [Methylomonas sp.]